MHSLRASILLLALAAAGVFVPNASARDGVEIDSSTYAAIAFSPSTGKYGYAWNCGTLTQARRIALSYCKESDAEVVTWVQFGWAVLVIGEDGSYGYATAYGEGASSADAQSKATRELRKYSDKPIKTILIVCSGDVQPKIINRK
jgi:hypothetical protein